MNEYAQKDLKYIWHPCSQMKDYEELPPIVIERGKGPYLYDVDGNKYLDCISSWWTNIFGHSNKRINMAIQNQVNKLEHAIFANFSNIPAIELAEKLVEITPDRLTKIFYSDNGSSAVEIALKMSFHYYYNKGNNKKRRFVALSNSYHGETLGALSVGSLDLYNMIYKPLLMDVFRPEGPNCYRCKYAKDRSNCDAECFEDMEKLIKEKHEEICSVIIEPMVQGAGGMNIYSAIYLKKLRKICDEYNIHMIADEIAVGFGRTGTMFACEHAEISPDIMCLSKGLSAGYMPFSAVMCSEEVYKAFYDEYSLGKAFMHSHTYCGNAMAAAIALESLRIFEEDNVLKKNKEKAAYLKSKVLDLRDNPWVGDIRNIGLITAIELVADQETKAPFISNMRVGYEIYKIALKKGLILRPLGNILYFNPPYVITKKDIDFMVSTCKQSIEEYQMNEPFCGRERL